MKNTQRISVGSATNRGWPKGRAEMIDIRTVKPISVWETTKYKYRKYPSGRVERELKAKK